MPASYPTERAVHPKKQALGETAVPVIPAGSARWTLGLLSLMPAALVSLGIFSRLGEDIPFAHSAVLPLMGIYGLIGANFAVLLFVVLALKSPFLDDLQRIGWAVVLMALAPVALPVFWYRIVMHPLRYGTAPEQIAHHAMLPRMPHRHA